MNCRKIKETKVKAQKKVENNFKMKTVTKEKVAKEISLYTFPLLIILINESFSRLFGVAIKKN